MRNKVGQTVDKSAAEVQTFQKEEPETQAESGFHQKCRSYTSRNVETTLQEMSNLHLKKCRNYTSQKSNKDINNNYMNNNLSIHQNLSSPGESPAPGLKDGMDGIDDVAAIIEQVRKNISYDIMMSYYAHKQMLTEQRLFEELYGIICEVLCVQNRKTIQMGGEWYPYKLVREQFLKLQCSHLEYVIECVSRAEIYGNVSAYLRKALYNAPNTIAHYSAQQTREDMLQPSS